MPDALYAAPLVLAAFFLLLGKVGLGIEGTRFMVGLCILAWVVLLLCGGG